MCTYSKEEFGGLSHELIEQFMEFHKSLPCLWRGKIKDCFNKQLKILPIKTCSKIKKLIRLLKKCSKEIRGSM
jgi:hypothetical protein